MNSAKGKKMVHLNVPDDVKVALVASAWEHRRTITGECLVALEKHLQIKTKAGLKAA